MMSRFRSAAVALFFLGIVYTPPAFADPLTITTGFVHVQGFGPYSFIATPIQLVAPRGFTVDARGGEGFFGPGFDCFYGCTPGSALDLSANWGGSDLAGTATFEGVSYPLGGVNQDGNVSLRFVATGAIPARVQDTLELSAPFQFTGIFWHGLLGTDAMAETLLGAGRVTTTLEWRFLAGIGEARYVPLRTVYELEDPGTVPEPGTMILVGSMGALALARRLRRRT